MNDNIKRYFGILRALRQVLGSSTGTHEDHHLMTLAAMISGIVGSKNCQLPAIASKTKLGGLRPSREKRYYRWLKREDTDWKTYYFPFLPALLTGLSSEPLYLIMDGSKVGRDCMTLMLSVVYKKRALPLVWTVAKKKKGHFPAEAHIALFEQLRAHLHALAGPDRPIIFLGDGEFDSVELQTYLKNIGWQYACRTSKNILVSSDGQNWKSFEQLSVSAEFPLEPGVSLQYHDVFFTEQAYGPVHLGAVWDKGQEEPIYLVTSLSDVSYALECYKKRFRVETFFSDQKSRGFHIQKSHLSDPVRLSRLIIATALAYCWLVFLGATVMEQRWVKLIHRGSRCDLSYFQLGLVWLDHCLNENIPVNVCFSPP